MIVLYVNVDAMLFSRMMVQVCCLLYLDQRCARVKDIDALTSQYALDSIKCPTAVGLC